MDERAVTEQVATVAALLDEIESLPDPSVRATVGKMVHGLLAFHGAGLAHMLTHIELETDDATRDRVFEAFSADEIVSHLLLLHDVHPISVETRVTQALEDVRPYLASHGGGVELVRVAGGVAHVRLEGSCNGCPSSTMTLTLAIEEAIRKAAPDLDGVEAEGVVAPTPAPVGFVPLTTLQRARPASASASAQGQPTWTTETGLMPLPSQGPSVRDVAGTAVLFVEVAGVLYAYHDACPGCGGALAQAAIDGPYLTCPGCARRFDVRQAGRSADQNGSALHMEPIPLLVRDDGVRVACGRPEPVSIGAGHAGLG